MVDADGKIVAVDMDNSTTTIVVCRQRMLTKALPAAISLFSRSQLGE